MVLLVKKISLSLKLLLSFLFAILLLVELVDGVTDISDWVVPFFFLLMFNDFLIHAQMIKGKPFSKWTLSKRASDSEEIPPYKKIIINFIIVSALLGSFLLELTGVADGVRQEIYKWGVVLWSLFFLGNNIYHLLNCFKISRLVVTNIALFIFVGSLVLI